MFACHSAKISIFFLGNSIYNCPCFFSHFVTAVSKSCAFLKFTYLLSILLVFVRPDQIQTQFTGLGMQAEDDNDNTQGHTSIKFLLLGLQ